MSSSVATGEPSVSYAYDAMGRVAAITNALGETTEYAYDTRGNRISERGATYPVDYAYDVYGNKVSMTTYRDEALANGDTTRWLYDEPSGCMTNKIYADGKGPSYDYTPDCKLARRVWARGIATDYSYDNAGQLVSTTYSDTTPTITMTYDRVGNLVNATTAGVVTNLYAYDLYGHCTNEWQNDFNLTRFYDDYGRDTGYALNGERQTTIAYDSVGRISTMSTSTGGGGVPPAQGGSGVLTASNENEFVWSYLPNTDLKASLQYPNDLTASWSYDANNQLLQVRNATPTNVISQFDYMYDAAGRRTAIAQSGSAFGDLSGATDSYGYNSRNEVISARRTKNNEAIHGFNEDFEYDPIGNRTSSTTYNELGEPKTSQYIANNLNQYTSRTVPGYAAVRGHADADATVTVNEKPTYRYGEYFFGSDEFDNFTAPVNAALGTVAVKPGATEDEPDEIASVTNSVYLAKSPVTYEYDEDGNMTEDARFRYYWNGENRMIRAEEKSAPPGRQPYVIAYAYDHMGRNVVNDGAKFIWDDYNVIVEDAASSNATFNTWGLDLDGTMQGAGGVGGLLAVQKGEAVYLPIYDANGNISEYVSSDGVIVAHYAYSSFGKLLMANDEISFTHRFSTKPYCAKTELVEFEFRKYAPNVGRWSSRDVVEFANQYPFVYNSTLVYYEFLGLYGNPVAGPGGINWGPSSPYEPKGPFTPPPPEDTSWAQNLPNCPCNIPIEPSGCPNPTGAGDGWSSPERTGHNGGSWEIRSMPNAAGAGQQCVYDAAGNLINKGSGAGTPDRYSPNGFFYTIKHFIVDVLPYYQNLYKYGPNAAEIFDHRDHPVNPGADSNGYPCPLNDGSDNPPLPCTNCN